MDGFGRVLALIIAALLLFMIPLRSKIDDYKTYEKYQVKEQTKDLVNDVMEIGYLSLDMYENYVNILNSSAYIYDIELVHSQKTLGVLGALMEVCKSCNQDFDKNISKQCPRCPAAIVRTNTNICDRGHHYFLKPGVNDKGCPYCTNNEFDNDKIQTYIEKTYTSQILEELYLKGIYEFNIGDHFSINIRKLSKTDGTNFIRVFSFLHDDYDFSYGGRVYGKIF